MTANRTELMAGLALLLFSVFAWREAAGIRGAAAMFPRAITVILGFFSLLYLLRSIFNGRAGEPFFKNFVIFCAILVGSIIYIQSVVFVGYVTSTAIFVPLISWVIGFRRPVYIAIVTIIYVLSIYFIFEVIFKRPMPDDLSIQLIRSLF